MHVLAAYCSIPRLSRTDGAFTPPTDTFVWLRSLTSIPFDTSIVTATRIYGVRIGSKDCRLATSDLYPMEKRLTRISNNTNFSLDLTHQRRPRSRQPHILLIMTSYSPSVDLAPSALRTGTYTRID